MPRFAEDIGHGYDLDLELPYVDKDGVRYLLGSAGSLILSCPDCGHERFREHFNGDERCWTCKTPLEPRTTENRDRLDTAWLKASHGHLIPAQERRAKRLVTEKERPWVLAFGTMTEADFPLGYVTDEQRAAMTRTKR